MPRLPAHAHFLQVFWGNLPVLPGHPSRWFPLNGICPKYRSKEGTRKHPEQMPEPQMLLSTWGSCSLTHSLLSGDWSPHPIFKGSLHAFLGLLGWLFIPSLLQNLGGTNQPDVWALHHIKANTVWRLPDPVRSLKLSRAGPGQCLDGRLWGNTSKPGWMVESSLSV